ncbi:MAG: glycoside hydrolase family 3 protein, partial [Tannerellaceae bacterium]
MLCIICQSIFAIGQEFKYKDPSLPVDDRVTDLLRRMTLEEKIAQMRHIHANSIVDNGTLNEDKLSEIIGDNSFGFVEAITFSGKDCLVLMNQIQNYILKNTRLSIPIFTVSESLHGSVHDGSTIYPQAIALGSTFNTDLAYRMTSSIARELRAQGIIQTLTPVLDVCRDLRWGRVEECFGEDPFLVSKMGIAQVKGYLDNKISPMIKHFGAHGTPQGGLNLASVACGERELLSIYLKPFEEVVTKTDIWAVMSSYNSWNNEPNTASHYLLTDLLRNRWGFKGYVYSDWGAIGMLDFFHHTAVNRAEAAMQALLAGVDAEAADNCYLELKWLVENGYLDVRFIDQAVGRILKAKFELGLFEIDQMKMDDYDLVVHSKENKLLARKIADESVILLKNNNNLLPLDLSRLKSIAVIGPNADTVQFGDYTWSRDNKDGKTLFQSLKKKCEGKVRIDYAKGCDLVTTDKTSFENAINIARKSDISIIVVGSASASLARDYSNATSGEGFDLSSLDLPGVQEDLIKEIHAIGKPVVVVLLSG